MISEPSISNYLYKREVYRQIHFSGGVITYERTWNCVHINATSKKCFRHDFNLQSFTFSGITPSMEISQLTKLWYIWIPTFCVEALTFIGNKRRKNRYLHIFLYFITTESFQTINQLNMFCSRKWIVCIPKDMYRFNIIRFYMHT